MRRRPSSSPTFFPFPSSLLLPLVAVLTAPLDRGLAERRYLLVRVGDGGGGGGDGGGGGAAAEERVDGARTWRRPTQLEQGVDMVLYVHIGKKTLWETKYQKSKRQEGFQRAPVSRRRRWHPWDRRRDRGKEEEEEEERYVCMSLHLVVEFQRCWFPTNIGVTKATPTAKPLQW